MATSNIDSTIGPGTTIRGTISGAGALDVMGHVEGQIDVDGNVTVSSSARIKAPVQGRRVEIEGAVAGDINATEAIVLDRGARVVGDLNAPTVGIRPGGLLRGYVATDGSSAPAGRSRVAKATSRSEAKTEKLTTLAARAPAAKESRPKTPTASRSTPSTASKISKSSGKGKPAPAPQMPNLRKKSAASRATTNRATATEAASKSRSRRAAPAPVVPSLKKGAKGAVKRRSR